MYEFTVDGMTCGHCASRIEKAVRAIDPKASVKIDIPAQKVSVASTLPEPRLKAAIEEAGYPVTVHGTGAS